MAWIESHQGIERHPKTIKLSIAMGWDIDQTIGKLHRLWWWCVDFAPDGNVSRHSADIVAQAIGLSADMADRFIKSLYEAEFLDVTRKKQYLIHDWLEYAGRYLRDTKFRRNPEKIKEIIDLYSTVVSRQSADKTPKISRKSAVPDLTLPNLKKTKKAPNPEVRVVVDYFFNQYNSKFGTKPLIGKKDAAIVSARLKKFTAEGLKDAVDFFLASPKAKEFPTLSTAMSDHSLNLFELKTPEAR